MPLLSLCLLIFIGVGCAQGAEIALAKDHPADIITILWWALGLLALFTSSIITGVSLWMVKKIIEHDKDIVAIRTKCKLEHDGEE